MLEAAGPFTSGRCLSRRYKYDSHYNRWVLSLKTIWMGVGIEKNCECLKSLEEGEECFLERKYRQHFNEQG